MRKMICLLVVIFIIGNLCACESTDEINKVQFTDFENVFVNDLPEEIDNPEICRDFYINRSKSLLGDPNYVLAFTLCFEEPSAFQTHINQLKVETAEILPINEKIYYVYSGSKEQVAEYTNTEIWDGYFFYYEIICVSRESQEVSYLYAYVWDYWKDGFLIDQLEKVFGTMVLSEP